MTYDALPTEVLTQAHGFFSQSRDFLLAWEILNRGAPQGESKQHVPWPVRAPVTCGATAIEEALKALITLDGRTPSRVHWTATLFNELLPATQQELASMLQIDGKPGTPANLLERLRTYDDGAPESGRCIAPLEAWRYMHDHSTVQHAEDVMYAVTRAIHDLVIFRRPDFGPWPGIIVP